MQNHFIIIYEQAYNKIFGVVPYTKLCTKKHGCAIFKPVNIIIHAPWMETWLNDNIKPKY